MTPRYIGSLQVYNANNFFDIFEQRLICGNAKVRCLDGEMRYRECSVTYDGSIPLGRHNCTVCKYANTDVFLYDAPRVERLEKAIEAIKPGDPDSLAAFMSAAEIYQEARP